MTMVMGDDLEFRLWGAAETTALGLGLGFSTGSEYELRRVIERGVRRIRDEDVAQDESKLRAAEFVLQSIVMRMADDARAKNYTELHEDTVDVALRWVCPVWPFC